MYRIFAYIYHKFKPKHIEQKLKANPISWQVDRNIYLDFSRFCAKIVWRHPRNWPDPIKYYIQSSVDKNSEPMAFKYSLYLAIYLPKIEAGIFGYMNQLTRINKGHNL